MDDIELRLVEPTKNRFRIYGITECKTLFGELCLRIVWGRLGNKRLRERSETFGDAAALVRRREELLTRRRRHGYVEGDAGVTLGGAKLAKHGPVPTPARTLERAIVEAHGLPLEDATARALVARWHAATSALARFLRDRGAAALDLVDVSTLAAMFVDACAA